MLQHLYRNAFFTSILVSCLCASFLIQGCMTSRDGTDTKISTSVEELIGGVPADSPNLNAIGSLGFHRVYYDFYSGEEVENYYYPFCAGSLIGRRMVLTAKHCAEEALYGVISFGIGPDGSNPDRVIEVVDYDLAPFNQGGWTGSGSDVGVLFLAERVTDVRPLRIGRITDEDIGQKYATIGYGLQQNNLGYTRRAGTVTLAALEGRIFELMFGSFDTFVDWYTSGGYYNTWPDGIRMPVGLPGIPIYAAEVTEPVPLVSISDSFDADIEDDPMEDDAGVDMEDDASIGDGGPYVDPYLEYLRQMYDETLLLDEYEAFFATQEGDSQPCYGDSGSPLIRPVDGRLTIFGVVSGGLGSSSRACDYGTISAIFAEDTYAFLRSSRSWEDPCGDVTTSGQCEGDIAIRCTSPSEGKRRITRTDCGLLLQTCGISPDGYAGCMDENGVSTATGTFFQPSRRPRSSEEVTERIQSSYYGINQ